MYIINDIENLILLNKMGVFNHIKINCGDILITNIRINDYSYSFQDKIYKVINKGLNVVELELEYYEFCECNRSLLTELGDGDKSSIYFATKSGYIIISSNRIISEVASKFGLESITVKEFVSNHISDNDTIELFNELMIA